MNSLLSICLIPSPAIARSWLVKYPLFIDSFSYLLIALSSRNGATPIFLACEFGLVRCAQLRAAQARPHPTRKYC